MGERIKDKVTVITGAACGIGAGAAKLFVEEGAKVVLADIQVDAGQALADELGDNARFIRADVTKEDDVAAMVDLAVHDFGRLDCIINNAGIVGAIGPIGDTPAEAWDATIAVLLRSVFLGMKHAARVMIPQKAGSIISVSSTAGVTGGLGPHAYTAAKHGIVGLTKSVGSELARHGIRVNAVAPGNTVSAMTSAVVTGDPANEEETAKAIEETSPLGIAGLPIDIGYAFLYLASNEARYVTGHTLVVDAGQTTGTTEEGAFHVQESDVLREAGKRGL